MAHFDFMISQNAKWGHAGFYIDCHRMTLLENILLQKSTGCNCCVCFSVIPGTCVNAITTLDWEGTFSGKEADVFPVANGEY